MREIHKWKYVCAGGLEQIRGKPDRQNVLNVHNLYVGVVIYYGQSWISLL